MIRMTKQADYGFVLLTRLATAPERVANAPELAAETRLPAPMVAKILKILARAGLLRSHRGVKGGYSLAKPPERMVAAEVLRALEGPVALTGCIDGSHGECEREEFCDVRGHWHEINAAIARALSAVTLAHLAADAAPPRLVQLGKRAEKKELSGREAGALAGAARD